MTVWYSFKTWKVSSIERHRDSFVFKYVGCIFASGESLSMSFACCSYGHFTRRRARKHAESICSYRSMEVSRRKQERQLIQGQI